MPSREVATIWWRGVETTMGARAQKSPFCRVWIEASDIGIVWAVFGMLYFKEAEGAVFSGARCCSG